jgi:DNA ligase (NAD+)
MYSKEQVIEIQKRTQQLVQANHTEKAFEIVENLRQVLQFHEYRYYVLNDPLISDTEYDQLFKLLEKIEKANPELITSTSPTQRVGNSLNTSFKTVPHLVPMLSLENSYNADDLIDWDRKAKEVAQKQNWNIVLNQNLMAQAFR